MDINELFINEIIKQSQENRQYKKMWNHFKKLKFDNQTISILMNELERQYILESTDKTIVIEIDDDNYTKLVKGLIEKIGCGIPKVVTIKKGD